VSRYHLSLLAAWLAVFAWSAIHPKDYFTWLLEVAPAIIGLTLPALTWRRFRFTPLLYFLICLHSIILMVGGHYTYAEVPLFDWIRDVFGLARNHYDRVGHFAQGFIPAMIAREVLLRNHVVARRGWLPFLIVSICLALSAFYEFIEWWTALATGEAATAFLGTQGDVWDTQWDMFLATCGASTALATLSRAHDGQLAAIR
jgi:putative membrane protein